VKPRLLGHWGTTPGQNFIYVHLNRAIRMRDIDMIYISGPGPWGVLLWLPMSGWRGPTASIIPRYLKTREA